MRLSKEKTWLAVAGVIAQRSTCLRRFVGCVLVDQLGQVLATGYNGVAKGLPHCNQQTGFEFVYANGIDKTRQLTGQSTGQVACYGHACSGAKSPSGTNLDGCEAIHAEQNALLQCRDVTAIETCFVTASPCVTCTKLLLNTGCQRIVFEEAYPQPQAQLLWEKAGRLWLQAPQG